MYSLESLKPLNTVFDTEHRLEQCDVEMVNQYIEMIGNTRREEPCPGDIIEYTDEYGGYYKNAQILALENPEHFLINACPYVPFVFSKDDVQEPLFNTDGGPSYSIGPASLTYTGKREKLFMVIARRCTLPAHSGIYFKAAVNTWEYIAPDQKHPRYSTKDWRRYYVSLNVDSRGYPKNGSMYRYFGDGIAFINKKDFDAWLKTYKSVTFEGGSDTQTVVFGYREKDYLTDRPEWDALDLPVDTRLINGINLVKVRYDDENHVVHTYRYTNAGQLDPRRYCENMLARGLPLEDILMAFGS